MALCGSEPTSSTHGGREEKSTSLLATRGILRFEVMLLPANFSSLVGEFMNGSIPKYSPGLVKNRYHNGHPDLLPAGQFPNDSAQHAGATGIEIKASRYTKSWQGHNAEDAWLMVFVFDSNRPRDSGLRGSPRSFRFIKVVGAHRLCCLAARGEGGDESADDYGQRNQLGVSEDGGKLDLPRQAGGQLWQWPPIQLYVDDEPFKEADLA